MEEFENLKEIVEKNEETLKEYDVYATVSLKEVQNLINKYKEQEKIIELMSGTIHQLSVNNDIAKYFLKRYCKTYYSGDILECKDLICETCVTNYFRKKAKGE